MNTLILGIAAVAAAVACLSFLLLAAPVRRAPLARRRFGPREDKRALTSFSDYLVALADRLLGTRSWMPFQARELELAGLRITPGYMIVTVGALSVATVAVVITVTANVWAGFLLAILVPVGAKLFLKFRTEKRQKMFTAQLDGSLQMMASTLRAGLSFTSSLDAVANDAESPTAEEFARVVNENRIGRDLVVALEQTAERMDSEDFRWVAEAVAVHRDTGGNLNEVLDRVGQTIRERNQVRQQVAALSAEGKYSGYVMMLIPVVVGGLFTISNPNYMQPLFNTTIGLLLLAASAVFYVIGGLWMKKIVNVRY